MVSVEDQIDHLLGNNSNDDGVVVPVVKSVGKGLFGFLRQFWYGALIGCLIVTITLIPIYGGRTGLDVLQEFFNGDDVDTLIRTGDPPESPDGAAYDYWYAPENSFGIQETKTVNWSYFKSLFLAHTDWMLEYKHYSYSEWTDGSDYLTIERTWNDTGFWKFNLIFDVPVDIYSARFTFGIDLPCLQYVEREGYEVWINYTANATETYSCMFNWSDIASIPNLVITKGRTDDMFWFRFRCDDIPAGVYEFDPTFGETGTPSSATSICSSGTERLYASYDAPASSGTADSITISFDTLAETVTYHCALYAYVDYTTDFAGALIDSTEQIEVTSSQDHQDITFDFDEPKPSIIGATNYYIALMITADGTSGTNKVDRLTTDNNGIWKSDFGSFDDPLIGDAASASRFVFWCSYTEGVVNTAPTVEVYSPDNASVGNNLTGYCRIWVNDTDGNDVNITWRTNESGSYITIADNNSVSCNASYDLYYPDFNSEDSQYWWEILCDDGTDNVSKRFWFETALNITEQIISQDINGSYTTLIDETIVDISINGSYTTFISQIIVDQTINGSYTSLISETIIDQNINGSYVVESITSQIIDQTINGSYVVPLVSERIISQTINGSYIGQAALIEKIIDQTINGSYTNVSVVIISLTDEYPTNGSNIFSVQPTLYFTLDSPVGEMSYKIYIGNTNITTDYLLDSEVGLDNDTFHYVNYYNASVFGVSYFWRVHYNDTATHVNETFNFSPVLAAGGGMGTGGTTVGIIGLIGIFGLFGGWLMHRRKQNARRPPNSLNRYRY